MILGYPYDSGNLHISEVFWMCLGGISSWQTKSFLLNMAVEGPVEMNDLPIAHGHCPWFLCMFTRGYHPEIPHPVDESSNPS